MIKPVYVFSGFLDAGKSSVIRATLLDKEFTGNTPSLILSFEEGDVLYDDAFLKETNSVLVLLDGSEQLTKEKILELEETYSFERVLVELNGLEKDEDFFKRGFAKKWELAETLAIFDASTFESHLLNMRSFVYDHIRYADVAIFNRADNADTRFIRNNIKAANPRLQIVFENRDGRIRSGVDDSFFLAEGDEIHIEDTDYGLWYMDAVDHPKKYDGKKIKVTLSYLEDIPLETTAVMMGRKAMVCCADDISNIVIAVLGVDKKKLQKENYYHTTGTLRVVQDTSGNETCVLYAEELKEVDAPMSELVYFS